MNDFIKEIFDLHGLVIYSGKVDGKRIIIKAGKLSNGDRCPHCNTYTRKIHERGKYREFKHTSLGNRSVTILLKRRRFKCSSNSICGRSFIESIPKLGIKPWKRRTKSFNEFVLLALRDQSFKALDSKFNISYSVARKAMEDLVEPEELLWEEEIKEAERGSEKPIKLGIDEHHFKNRKMLTTISNLGKRKILSVLRDVRKTTLIRFLKNIPEQVGSRITEVCIDMHTGYRNALKEALPKAAIIIDHFHVIQYANQRIDEERKTIQVTLRENKSRYYKIPRYIFLKNREDLDEKEVKRLKSNLESHPTLKTLYFAKESLRSMYKLEERQEAKHQLNLLISTLRSFDDPYMVRYGNTLREFKEEILNYFLSRTTNAYAEGINNKFKLIQRISFGFRNIDVYVRKAVLSFIPLSVIHQLPNVAH